MPIAGENRSGNLIVKFEIDFPKLDQRKMEIMDAILENRVDKAVILQRNLSESWGYLLNNLIVSPINKIVDYSKSFFENLFLRSRM